MKLFFFNFNTEPVGTLFHLLKSCVAASIAEPEPVWRPGSGSTLDKTEEILHDILSVRFNID